jgi:hypothetical protein
MFHHAVINIRAPRGVSRKEFETALRQKVELHLATVATNYAETAIFRAFMGMTVVIVMLLLCLSQFGPNSQALLVFSAAVVFCAAAGFLVSLLRELIDRSKPRPALQNALFVALIAGTSWALSLPEVRAIWNEEGSAWFLLAGVVALAGLLYSAAANLIVAVATISSSTRRAIENLDALVVESMLRIYHTVSAHKGSWGSPDIDDYIVRQIRQASLAIETTLMRRLPRHGLPKEASSRRGRRALGAAIAQELASHEADLVRDGGRRELLDMTNRYVPVLYSGAWLDLPRREVVVANEGLVWVRRAVSSLLPFAVIAVLRTTNVISAPDDKYAWLLATLWFVVSVGSWLDPNFADRLKTLEALKGIVKLNSSGSDKADTEPAEKSRS